MKLSIDDILKVAFAELELDLESKQQDPSLPVFAPPSTPSPVRIQIEASTDLVLSGSALFSSAIKFLNSDTDIRWHYSDGAKILKGQKVATLIGHLTEIVKTEIIAFNLLSHLSSVATYTHNLNKAVSDYNCKILKSNKFVVGLCEFENKAFLDGGGHIDTTNSETHLISLDSLELGDLPKLLKKEDPPATLEVQGDLHPTIILELAKAGVQRFRPQKNHNFEAEFKLSSDWKLP